MAVKNLKKDILNVPPDEEKGGEAIYGFDFQVHCTARLCLEMAQGHDVTEMVCEHHEDHVQFKKGQSPNFCSIKKRESVKLWTLALLKDAILKLFRKIQYKNVGELVIYGSGRPSEDGDYSLASLIALLDRSATERDSDWDYELEPYEDYFTKEFAPEIDRKTIKRGLRLLKIDLTMPNPEAIEERNARLTADVVLAVWGVEITIQTADRAYKLLYKKVWDASKKPKMPLSAKRISRNEAIEILKFVLYDGSPLAEKAQDLLDIHTKLCKGNLEKHIIYALQRRMDARQTKFELELKSTEWEDFKTQIAVDWDEFSTNHLGLIGPKLWQQLRELLRCIGEQWESENQNNLLGPSFSEGIFFDMMAVCEADIGVK